jgi:ubiquinone biosynthesis protein
MGEQVGWRGMLERFKAEAPRYAQIFPQLPRLAHQALEKAAETHARDIALVNILETELRRTNRLLTLVTVIVGVSAVAVLAIQVYIHWPGLR